MLPTELWALCICQSDCAAAKARHSCGMQIVRALLATFDMSMSRLSHS